MISQKTFHHAQSHAAFMVRWHRQHGWRMEHVITRRMQQNTNRWHCLYLRNRRETLLAWARTERNGYAACSEARNRLPSRDDIPRAAVYWHMANTYARVALGEPMTTVLADEEQQLLIRIRAYNASQEKILHTWHGYAGYYGEDEVRTKMLHAKHRIQRLGY